mmetsp:Transcript_11828/g.19348  ORF Transcript_11828/g.19348 Transcript_11828/m.19348 type:complete len:83 (+) Transcript_11828:962-1210(+)
MLSRSVASLLELLLISFGMSAAEINTTMMKIIIGVTMKNIVGRLRIRELQRVAGGVFWLLLPMDISAGYEPLSPTTRASVRS